MRRMSRPFMVPLIIALSWMLAACASAPRVPYTVAEANSARVLNLDDLRRYADEPASAFVQTRLFAGPRNYLALSGGGADGAYGAGLLNGWTAAGTRPSFSIVSGVSTGALIAPFAFLGPQYDPTLRQFYTSGVAETLLESPNPLNAIFGSGLFGNKRLRELVAEYINEDFVASVAAEYAKGRLLFVVTTNLDSQRSVIWNLGRIASLGTTQSLNLFRDVVAASASLPAVFPPMLISAEAGGARFQEMHVDGGVIAPVLTLPEAYLLRNASGKSLDLQLYILINNKIEPEFQVVTDRTLEIASRSSSTLVKAQTRSILFSTYGFAKRNKYGFNLSYIEADRPVSPAGFNTAYMRDLFQYGYDKALSGHAWVKAPPADGPATAPMAEATSVRQMAGAN
ncbi:patatin-like phospholipase family protein [Rhodopseudomonas sp. HC1]|uniref:patatin-like phospholipase family protein n=1 Tax=Rhodopseudomonas infernalis TaxID=2897386 RepID=UPI001EE78986|nr:patatin-like phospholipase family protein [Rhodopseudomonas infernalis]MCG6203076.1 patatin-like phospholipase family protein [Rhodopseudomonas infernalis]